MSSPAFTYSFNFLFNCCVLCCPSSLLYCYLHAHSLLPRCPMVTFFFLYTHAFSTHTLSSLSLFAHTFLPLVILRDLEGEETLDWWEDSDHTHSLILQHLTRAPWCVLTVKPPSRVCVVLIIDIVAVCMLHLHTRTFLCIRVRGRPEEMRTGLLPSEKGEWEGRKEGTGGRQDRGKHPHREGSGGRGRIHHHLVLLPRLPACPG